MVMAGLVPAISLRNARPCLRNRDARASALRAGPGMTKNNDEDSYFAFAATSATYSQFTRFSTNALR